MVDRLFRIFGEPTKPESYRQDQFDEADEALRRTANKAWHEIDQTDYWHYLMDLCYVELDQDLFDYLFPAFLIRWWEGMLNRTGGPESECDIYRAIDHGQVMTKMMDADRRSEVLSWMVDAYMEGVDAWGGQLSVAYSSNGPNDLHGPLWYFHALGQSVPIIDSILGRLADVCTEGRAQWWLVFASGLIWNEDEAPMIPPWTPDGGGGGVYILESAASIYNHGYLGEHHAAIKDRLTYEFVHSRLCLAGQILQSTPQKEWSQLAVEEMRKSPEYIELRIVRFMELLSEPDLGGVLNNPLDT